jgi:hypothetical protein
MSASLYIPISVSAKTRKELTIEIMKVQAKENGKVSIVAIYYDSEAKEHVCWYYPIRNLGAMS